MQVIVVAGEGQESVARKLAYAISKSESVKARMGIAEAERADRPFTAAMWTTEHYVDNEASLFGNEIGIVFVGKSGPARDFRDELPPRFASMGTDCHAEGRRAVLWAEVPGGLDLDELRNLGKQLGVATDELVKRIEKMGKAQGAALAGAGLGMAGGIAVPTAAVAAAAAGAVIMWVQPLLLVPAAALWVVRRRDRKRLIKKVNDAQYSYLVTRFIADVLPGFLDA